MGKISRDAAVIGNGNPNGGICQASRGHGMPIGERLLQAPVDHQAVVCDPWGRPVRERHGYPSTVDSNLAAGRSCYVFSLLKIGLQETSDHNSGRHVSRGHPLAQVPTT